MPPDIPYNNLAPPGIERSSADSFDLKKAYENQLARQKWGPDMPWYLPESLVGDWLYRNQGIGLHGLMAAGTATKAPPIAAGNLGYILWSLANGRTARPKIGAGGIPLTDNEVPGATSGAAYSAQHESKRADDAVARRADRDLERQLGLVTNWSGPNSLFGPHPEPDDAKRARAVQEYLAAGGL
jgi:hypothetical protein